MTSSGTLRVLREFWSGFGRLPLYNTGFDDAVKQCGADRAETHEDASLALAYLRGYADAAKLVCPYMGPHWQIADALSSLTCTLLFAIGNDTLTTLSAEGLCRGTVIELAELVRKKADPLFLVAGGGT